MRMNPPMAFLVAATAINGMMAGATLDQSLKQLPARRDLGPLAYSAYAQAADFKRGVRWYPAVAVATVISTGAAAVTGMRGDISGRRPVALLAAAAGTVGHMLITARAAPVFLSIRRLGADDAAVADTLDRFARLQAVRATVQCATLLATVWALVETLTSPGQRTQTRRSPTGMKPPASAARSASARS